MTLLYIVLWYAVGVASFIYWWTRDYDFTTGELGLALLEGIIGPLAFIFGAIMHSKGTYVLVNKRTK